MKKSILFSYLIFLASLMMGCTAGQNLLDQPVINPGSWMVVPAGEFQTSAQPETANIVSTYEIMSHDVTNQQYVDFLIEAGKQELLTVENETQVVDLTGELLINLQTENPQIIHVMAGCGANIPSFYDVWGYSDYPVTYVTQKGAETYCEFYGARLPTLEEWEKASGPVSDKQMLSDGSRNSSRADLSGWILSLVGRDEKVGFRCVRPTE